VLVGAGITASTERRIQAAARRTRPRVAAAEPQPVEPERRAARAPS
jgi:hypothetical protein